MDAPTTAKKAKKLHSRQCQAFLSYFKQDAPKKRKRGRPRKKKRVSKNKRKRQIRKQKQAIIDLTGTALLDLSAELGGVSAKAAMHNKSNRINWDKGKHKELRERLAVAWQEKTAPLYQEDDSFYRFCKRNAIDRSVLARYLKKKQKGEAPSKRGRRPGLSEDVMRHLCERKLLPKKNMFCFACVLNWLFVLFCFL